MRFLCVVALFGVCTAAQSQLLGLAPGNNSVALVHVDHETLATTTLFEDSSGNGISSSSFGAFDVTNEIYYTLMQPSVSAGIELASFQFKGTKVSKSLQPLDKWVACGRSWNGSIVGVDEDEVGVYFARINPTSGHPDVLRRLPPSKTLGSCGQLDPESSLLYAVIGSETNATEFDLYSFDVLSGDFHSTRIWPTPDSQGPTLPTLVVNGTLLVFAPGTDCFLSKQGKPRAIPGNQASGWQLFALDVHSGRLSPTNSGLPALSVLQEDVSWLLPAHNGSKSVLVTGFAAELGMPVNLYSIDVDCALDKSRTDESCLVKTQPWPGGLIDLVVVEAVGGHNG